MTPLGGRVGVVTGASAGIGAAVARALADAGMAVVLGAWRVPSSSSSRSRTPRASARS